MDTIILDAQTGQPIQTPGTNGLAVVSLVCGIVGMFGCCCCPIRVASLAAIVCGHSSLAQMKSRLQAGKGLAIAGLVMGYLMIALMIAQTLAVFVNPEFGKQMEKLQQDIKQQIERPKQSNDAQPNKNG
jgi:hypothetical protein